MALWGGGIVSRIERIRPFEALIFLILLFLLALTLLASQVVIQDVEARDVRPLGPGSRRP